MTVSDVMSRGLQGVTPGTPVPNALALMKAKGIHHLLVLDHGALAGVLSTRDLARRGRRAPGTVTVRDLMTHPVVSVTPGTSMRRAANVMRGRSVGCLVVVDGEVPVGLVTVADLLERLAGPRRHRRDPATPPALRHRVPHVKQHGAGGAW